MKHVKSTKPNLVQNKLFLRKKSHFTFFHWRKRGAISWWGIRTGLKCLLNVNGSQFKEATFFKLHSCKKWKISFFKFFICCSLLPMNSLHYFFIVILLLLPLFYQMQISNENICLAFGKCEQYRDLCTCSSSSYHLI